jgi:O-methyltransferase involved in polyketide biosynthesis
MSRGVSTIERRVFDGLANRVAAAGAPWQAFFEPATLKRDLEAMGFTQVADLGSKEINVRYFEDRADGLRVGSLAHVMSARI